MNFSYWEKESLFKGIDQLVIGMGLTGLQSAILLKEKFPKQRIVICDRTPWSLGASTRNAGFACFANVSEMIDDLEHHTEDEVYELAIDRYIGLRKLRDHLGDSNIGYIEKGSCEIFTDRNRVDLEKGLDMLQEINRQFYDRGGPDDVFYFRSISPWQNVKGTIQNRYEGQLNTGKLYTALLNKARQGGIELLGGLELNAFESMADGVEVKFNNGYVLRASNLVICTNGFAGAHTGEDVVPARGQVLLTGVLDRLPCEGLHHFDKGYYYWRDLNGRILLGGARNLDLQGEESSAIAINDRIQNELKRFLFEQICGKEVLIEHTWSGIMGMGRSKNKKPVIKALKSNVYAAVRHGGMGVALSALSAEKLVNLIEN